MISLLRRSRRTLGLDVGSGFVKAVVVDHSGAEPELVQAIHLPLPADAIVEGEVIDAPQVADAVRTLVGGLEAEARTVAVAVGGRDVIVKKISMDRMPEADAREVIRWEAPQYVPFDMESVQLDLQILDPDGEGLEMSVLLVAAKRELVEQKLRLLGDAGLTPAIVDVEAFALHNAFQYNYPDVVQGMAALLNVGHETATVNILHEGVPVVTRDVPFGARHLREDLRRTRGLSGSEADALLQSQEPMGPELRALLEERTADLALGVERAMAFTATDVGQGRGLSAVYLSGGAAHLPGLADAVAARLRVRTEVANPLQRLRVGPSAAIGVPSDELTPMLMLSVGLALRTEDRRER